MRLNRLFVTAIMVSLFAACTGKEKEGSSVEEEQGQGAMETKAVSATSLPAFALQDLQGNTVELTSLKGKKVFVNLWASWCPPCRREMPSIQKLYQSVDTSKVSFVMLSLDDSFSKAKDYVAEQQLRLPVYYPAGQLPTLFNVNGIPATFIFDENGELMKKIEGSDNYDTEQYRQLIQ